MAASGGRSVGQPTTLKCWLILTHPFGHLRAVQQAVNTWHIFNFHDKHISFFLVNASLYSSSCHQLFLFVWCRAVCITLQELIKQNVRSIKTKTLSWRKLKVQLKGAAKVMSSPSRTLCHDFHYELRPAALSVSWSLHKYLPQLSP